jgi:REP element-mobilizing transposase RayT
VTYLITFACYGCHLHGEPAGSADRHHNTPGGRFAEASAQRLALKRVQMDQPPYNMDEGRRRAVLASILDRCSNRAWRLLAAHVRTNHVHVLIEAEVKPERVMNDLKSFASRRLNELGLDGSDRKRWARHGSTRWLWNRKDVLGALQYVVDKQGVQMAVYESTEP